MLPRRGLAVLAALLALASCQGQQSLLSIQEESTSQTTPPEVRIPLDFLMMQGDDDFAFTFGFRLLENIRNIRMECEIIKSQEEIQFSSEMKDMVRYRKEMEAAVPKSEFEDLSEENRASIEKNFDDAFEAIEVDRTRKLQDLQAQCDLRIDTLLSERKREALNYTDYLMRTNAVKFAQLLYTISGYRQQLQNGLAGCMGYYRAIGESNSDGGMEDPRELCYGVEIDLLVAFIQRVVIESTERSRNLFGDDEDYGVDGSGEEDPSLPRRPAPIPMIDPSSSPPEQLPTTIPLPTDGKSATTDKAVTTDKDTSTDPVKETESEATEKHTDPPTTEPPEATTEHTTHHHKHRPSPRTEGYPDWADDAFNAVEFYHSQNPNPKPQEAQIQTASPETPVTSEETVPPSENPTPEVPRPSIGQPLDIHVMTPPSPEEPTTGSEAVPRPSIGRPLDIHVMTPLPPENPTTGSEAVPRPSIGQPLDIHVMTPVSPEEPTTGSEVLPRPSIGRPLDVHVITPESPTTGAKTDHPSDKPTPPMEITTGEPTTTDSSDEVDVELNIPGVGSIDVDIGADGVRVNGEVDADLENPTGTVEIIDTAEPEEIIIDPSEETHQDDFSYVNYIVTYVFVSIGGILVITIFFLVVAILVMKRRSRERDTPLLSEEKKIAVMKQTGYVNPTYKFFDQTVEI